MSSAKVLGSPQCFKCFSYDLEPDNCQVAYIICLHCTENHLYKDCSNKSKSQTCNN